MLEVLGDMKILCKTASGDGLCVPWYLQEKGHEVDVFVKEPGKSGEGMFHLVSEPKSLKSYDLVVCNGRDFCDTAEIKVPAIIGPTALATRLEIDRAFGMRMMEALGIDTPEWKLFHDIEAAKTFAKKYGKPLVLKPNGKKATSMLTLVGEEDDNDDLLSLIDLAVRHNPGLAREGFLLQERIDGIEMSAGSFFDGFTFAQPVMLNFENKKLAPKPWAGPSTGEMGSHCLYAYSPKLFRETTEKMMPLLREMKYHGDFDINCIITKQGPKALEMTPRVGFPAVCLQMVNYDGDFGKFLYEVATGLAPAYKARNRWAVGVLLTCPPFPYEELLKDDDLFTDIPVYGEFTTGIYPLDVDREQGAYYSSGSGWVAVACGTGDSLSEAQGQAYKRLKTLKVPNSFARQDIGDRFFAEKEELEKGGWLS